MIKLPMLKPCVNYSWNGIHVEPHHACKVNGECKPIQDGPDVSGCDDFQLVKAEVTCMHLGKPTGEKVDCVSCSEKRPTPTLLKTHDCEVHGVCVLGKEKVAGVMNCADCPNHLVPRDFPRPERTIRIDIPKHYNCSLIEWNAQTLLATRKDAGKAQVHLSELDGQYRPYWTQQLVMEENGKEISAEDPRLFVYAGQLHVGFTTYDKDAASVMIARLSSELQVESVMRPKLKDRQSWEKNWMFFDHEGELHSIYAVSPHTILRHKGESAEKAYQVSHGFRWPSVMRGGAAPIRICDEYYHWFHAMQMVKEEFRYTAGLYTFEAQPPFAIRRVISNPMLFPDYGDRPKGWKKSVVYPCGAVLKNGKWLLSYGHQDRQCCIAIFDADKVERALHPLKGTK